MVENSKSDVLYCTMLPGQLDLGDRPSEVPIQYLQRSVVVEELAQERFPHCIDPAFAWHKDRNRYSP